MKNLLVLLLLTSASAPALAEWSLLSPLAPGNVYIDPLTMRTGTRPRIWMLHDYGQPDEYGDLSGRMLMEANCTSGQIRQLSGVFHKDAMGRGAATSEFQTSPWAAAADGSAPGVIYRFLCGGKP